MGEARPDPAPEGPALEEETTRGADEFGGWLIARAEAEGAAPPPGYGELGPDG